MGAQDVHTHCGLCCLVWESRIVCAVEAAPEPITGGVVVNVSGKLGHSPAHVQFTYQVGAWPFDLEGCVLTRAGVGRVPNAPAQSECIRCSSSSRSRSAWSQSRGPRQGAPH